MFKNIKELFRLGRILARNDCLFFLEEIKNKPFWLKLLLKFFARISIGGTKGERLSRALQQMGPIYIKLGQALAVRPDIVGIEIANELSVLQDKLPPFSSDIAIKIIEDDLGEKLDNLFLEFDPAPVAAASISQVHFAKLHNGKEVAVKILRPDIEQQFAKDVKTLYFLGDILLKYSIKSARLKPKEVVDELKKTISSELDLRMEGAAASELKQNLSDFTCVKIPEVIWDYTTRRVLTLERVDGIRIDDINSIEEKGFDKHLLAKNAAELFFTQASRDGFFHADLHPGNVMIDNSGKIVLVDFGIMGRLDLENRIFLAHMILGFLERDYYKVAKLHLQAGYIPANSDLMQFAQACRSIGEPILGKPQSQISIARLLLQLFKISEDFNMQTQTHLILLQKTMVMAEGIGRILYPEVNFWELARPLMTQWGKKNLSPRAYIKRRIEKAFEISNQILNIAEKFVEEKNAKN